MLTLDIEYGSPSQRSATVGRSSSGRPPSYNQTAVFCLYRGPERVHKDMAFRDADGNPVSNSCLRLFLSDFIPDDVLRDLPASLRRRARSAAVTITAQQLCDFLTKATLNQQAEDEDIERFEKRLHESGPPSKKRKSVHWDLGTDADADADAESEAAPSRSSSESNPRSKKRKTDLEYRPSSRSQSSVGASRDPPRRTRSMTRSNEGSQPRRRTRSNTAQSDDASVGRPSRPRTRSAARSEEGAT